MSDIIPEELQDEIEAEARADLARADELRLEILERLDCVYEALRNGVSGNTEQKRLLALLPEEQLEQIANTAEEYSACVLGYARLVRFVMKKRARDFPCTRPHPMP